MLVLSVFWCTFFRLIPWFLSVSHLQRHEDFKIFLNVSAIHYTCCMVFPSLMRTEDKLEKNGCALKCQPLFHWKKRLANALADRVFILMMSAVKIQCPHAKALPFHGAKRVQTSAFLPGPSPWKKSWLLGKEPDLPTQQDIHVCLPTHSGDGNLGSCTHATPVSSILSFVLFVLFPRLGVSQSTENSLQLAK